jgi:short-subunit dehydrogenase
MTNIKEQYGPWALVTGASSGIGTEFARQLAAEGLNLVLVARREEALHELGDELERDHRIETFVVAQDLANDGAAASVLDAVADLDVGLVVSNAGAGKMGGFLQNSSADLRSMLMLNVITQMELSHGFATRLASRGRRGGLLLLSSTTAFQPVPLGANYAAAKSYILNLGEALHSELKPLGIDVSVLVPGPTKTPGLLERDDVDFSVMPLPPMEVSDVVREGLNALVAKKRSRVPGLLNRLMAALTPRSLAIPMWGSLLRKGLAPRLLPANPAQSPAE